MPKPRASQKKGLTPRQAKFVAEYLRTGNATAAAVAAGYSAKSAESTACNLLKHPKISQVVARKVKALDFSADRVLQELARIALADLGQAFDENGNLLPLPKIPEDLRRAVAAFDVIELPGDDAGLLKKVKACDKVRALELLAKYHGLLVEKVEHEHVVAIRVDQPYAEKGPADG